MGHVRVVENNLLCNHNKIAKIAKTDNYKILNYYYKTVIPYFLGKEMGNFFCFVWPYLLLFWWSYVSVDDLWFIFTNGVILVFILGYGWFYNHNYCTIV